MHAQRDYCSLFRNSLSPMIKSWWTARNSPWCYAYVQTNAHVRAQTRNNKQQQSNKGHNKAWYYRQYISIYSMLFPHHILQLLQNKCTETMPSVRETSKPTLATSSSLSGASLKTPFPAMILAPEPIGTTKNWKAEDHTRVRRSSGGDGSSWRGAGTEPKNWGLTQCTGTYQVRHSRNCSSRKLFWQKHLHNIFSQGPLREHFTGTS